MTSLSRNLSDQIIEIIILGFAIWGRSLCCGYCDENTLTADSLMAPGARLSNIS